MIVLNCNNLLSSLNATVYQVPPLPEDMTSFGDDAPQQVATKVNLDYEISVENWKSIPTLPSQANDPRLPRTFVDGALNSVEIAGSVQDSMGYARSIRAGQLGVGAINLDTPDSSTILCSYLMAVTTMGYTASQLTPLKNDLQNHPREFSLITWEATSDAYFKTLEDQEIAVRDFVTVRGRLRRRVTDVMLEHERDLVRHISLPIYADGRYVNHSPLDNKQLVIGVIKSMRRRYLDLPRLQVLYNLKPGERTPAFEMQSHKLKVISFYARISSTVGGATNGIVRVEVGKNHFESYQHQDWTLLNAITAHMTQLRTKDSTYTRAAVTLEPIQVIEQRMQRLFHPIERVSMSALNALR